MSNRYVVLALVMLLSLAGSSRGGAAPPVVSALSSEGAWTAGGVVRGSFTEYLLPPGARPMDFTYAYSYHALWFIQSISGFGAGVHVYRFSTSNGAVSTFTLGPPYFAPSSGIVSTGGYVYFFVANTNGPGQLPEFLGRVTPAGVISLRDSGLSDEEIHNLVIGSDGRIWFPMCLQSCSSFPDNEVQSISVTAALGPGVRLPNFSANHLTPGPAGNLYATAQDLANPLPTDDSAVFVIATSGVIIHRFALPHGSVPLGIATGSDHNLWIVEEGINKIARVTPSGVIKQFSVPTANAGVNQITPGVDSALWFTETRANKIGRITTSGRVTEYRIPTANSGASAILPCTYECPPHGGVWFTETNANRIGKFVSPL